jgi:hypothetical protein
MFQNSRLVIVLPSLVEWLMMAYLTESSFIAKYLLKEQLTMI